MAIAARAARGTATPIPIFAPVLRPLVTAGVVGAGPTGAAVIVIDAVEDGTLAELEVEVGISLLLKFN